MSFQTSPYEGTSNGASTRELPVPPSAEAVTSAHPTAQVAPGGPPIPQKRYTWLELPAGSGYQGFKFRAWINYPARLQREMQSGDDDKVNAALRQIVIEHNGWPDFEGQPYPPADDPDFWYVIPNELAIATLALVNAETGKLGISLANLTRRR